MGFSVSGSAAIIFIGIMVAAGVAVPSLVGSFGALAGSQSEQIDRGIDAMNTDLAFESATYDGATNELTLELTNAGSTTLGVDETTVLVDGVIPDAADLTTEVDADAASGLWLPGQRLTITVETVDPEPDRVKVVAENGIAETVSGEEIETV